MLYKILLAEDEPMMRRLMSTLLIRHNHEIIEATNGEDALILAAEHQPDIILLDIMMPLVSGFETLRRLRANPETQDIPVIFLSARGQVEDRVEGLRLGADDYVTKPAEPQELLARIEAVILRSRREARRRKGLIFGFVNAKGGVGKTAALVNLGIHFHRAGRSPLLVDMNLAFGDLAMQFGSKPDKRTIANLTVMSPAEIDISTIQELILHHDSGIQILASPSNVPSWATFSTEHLRTLVEQVTYNARYIFLDLPRNPDVLEAVADQLSGLILVLGSEPSCLRIGEELAIYLGNLGLSDRLSALLIHRHDAEYQFVDAGLIAERLGCLVLGTIPFKPELYLRAEYEQVPVLFGSSNGSDHVIFEKIGARLLNYTDTIEQFQKQRIYQDPKLS